MKADNRDDILPIRQKEENQISIFEIVDAPLDWRKEWQDMPEFIMGNTEPARKITVSFEYEEDAKVFAEKLELKITSKTDSVWFPGQREYIAPKNYRWSDES